ncbi:hypothetical protein D1007_57892 [Hordeum vulgare]|nr:hypothetical protein D1007_57892 [Hordeum vulgare]
MSCSSGIRGGRNGLGGEPPCKHRNDIEVGRSSLLPLAEEWHRKWVCTCSRSAGAGTLTNLDQLDLILSLELKHLRAAEVMWFEAKEVASTGDEAATTHVVALREDYQLAFVLSNSLMEHHLVVRKSSDGDDE